MTREGGFTYNETFKEDIANPERDILVASLEQGEYFSHLLKCSSGEGKNYYIIESYAHDEPVESINAPEGVEFMPMEDIKGLLDEVNDKNRDADRSPLDGIDPYEPQFCIDEPLDTKVADIERGEPVFELMDENINVWLERPQEGELDESMSENESLVPFVLRRAFAVPDNITGEINGFDTDTDYEPADGGAVILSGTVEDARREALASMREAFAEAAQCPLEDVVTHGINKFAYSPDYNKPKDVGFPPTAWESELKKEVEEREKFVAAYRNQPLPLIFQTPAHDRGCIITESTREGEGPCQISFFDSRGFMSHECGTQEKCLNALTSSIGIPEPMPAESFERMSSRPGFQSSALVAQYIQGWDDMDSLSARQLDIEFASQPDKDSTPKEIYRWLYKRGMDAMHVKALPAKDGFGANIDMKTRLKLSGYVFQSKEWNRLPKKDRQEGILAEPCLDKNVLKKLGAQPAR